MISRVPNLRRTVGAAALLALALTTTACAETVNGSGTRAGVAPAGSSATGGLAAAAASGKPAQTIAELASQLIAGTAHGTTAHMSMTTGGLGDASAALPSFEGDMRTKDGGALDAFSFEVSAGSESLSMVYVDGTAYVKFPSEAQTDPSKPWLKVSASSSDPVAASMAAAFDQIDKQTSLSQYVVLVKSAKDFGATGKTQVGGVDAQGYSFTIDPASLPNASQFGAAISKIGPIPATLDVDSAGRIVQLTEKISYEGQSVGISVTFTDYGKPVTIAAPPASQISGG